ncbi:MAG: 4'-phosphopantetheinyl transferase superfamily protein [Pseudorhodoplanes sp.]|nr:4'-phosphopantetheinyl transferase superfamily protein [Pseudorhodoplanes sp.]
MSGAVDPALAAAIKTLPAPGVLIGHRVIQPGDDSALLETEVRTVTAAIAEKRRASGAARIVGRALLRELGVPEQAIPKRVSGAPLWPDGITGSFAHDHLVAVAAAGLTRDVGALGIDIEPAVALPADMLDLVTTPNERIGIDGDPLRGRVSTPNERIGIDGDPLRGRVLFVVKEAVYKAVHPLDGKFLDYHDIDVDLAARKAVTRTGRTVDIRYCVSSHIVAVAWKSRFHA